MYVCFTYAVSMLPQTSSFRTSGLPSHTDIFFRLDDIKICRQASVEAKATSTCYFRTQLEGIFVSFNFSIQSTQIKKLLLCCILFSTFKLNMGKDVCIIIIISNARPASYTLLKVLHALPSHSDQYRDKNNACLYTLFTRIGTAKTKMN